ncbi:exosortase/archaeosortase family protein [Planctomycetota bacterium]
MSEKTITSEESQNVFGGDSNVASEAVSKSFNIHSWIKIAVIGALFISIFSYEIKRIVAKWVTDPSWSHGFLIPLFSVYFINQHKKEIASLQTKPNYLGLILLIGGLVFYPFNVIGLQYGYLRPIGMIATLGALVLFYGGWKLVKYFWLPVGFLVFAVPLPQRYYVAVTMPMRLLAAQVSNFTLNLVDGVQATVSGVIIDVIYRGKEMDALNVADACSGMRLLMAFLALGVAMAYLHYRPTWQRLILLSTTIPIAIFCNIIRVTVTGFIVILGNPKYAKGIYHDMLGMLMLPLAFFLYGAIAWFMANLVVDQDQAVTEDIIIRRKE